jgi:hypothetical protein
MPWSRPRTARSGPRSWTHDPAASAHPSAATDLTGGSRRARHVAGRSTRHGHDRYRARGTALGRLRRRSTAHPGTADLRSGPGAELDPARPGRHPAQDGRAPRSEGARTGAGPHGGVQGLSAAHTAHDTERCSGHVGEQYPDHERIPPHARARGRIDGEQRPVQWLCPRSGRRSAPYAWTCPWLARATGVHTRRYGSSGAPWWRRELWTAGAAGCASVLVPSGTWAMTTTTRATTEGLSIQPATDAPKPT